MSCHRQRILLVANVDDLCFAIADHQSSAADALETCRLVYGNGSSLAKPTSLALYNNMTESLPSTQCV